MQCTYNNKNVQWCSFCISTIPCHCPVITNEDHFASHVSSCNDKPTNFTKLHSVNLALFQHFFHESRLSHLRNTTLPNPVNILLPNFAMYKNKIDHIIASDQQSHWSLRKMASRCYLFLLSFDWLIDQNWITDVSFTVPPVHLISSRLIHSTARITTLQNVSSCELVCWSKRAFPWKQTYQT